MYGTPTNRPSGSRRPSLPLQFVSPPSPFSGESPSRSVSSPFGASSPGSPSPSSPSPPSTLSSFPSSASPTGRVGGLSPTKMNSIPRRSSPLVPTGASPSRPPSSGHPRRATSLSVVPSTPPRSSPSTPSRFQAGQQTLEPPSPTPTARTFTPSHAKRPSVPSPSPSWSDDGPLPIALPSSYQPSDASSSRIQEDEGEESQKVTSGGDRAGTMVGTGVSTMSSRWDDGTQADDREIDEDLEDALGTVRSTAQDKITQYKRLLEQSQTASSYALHSLQAELKNAKYELEVQRRAKEAAEKTAAQRSRLPPPRLSFPSSSSPGSFDLSSLSGPSGFDETAVRAFVRGLKQDDRQTLLRMLLESLLPGDVSAMIRTLERYALTTFDILGTLPAELAVEVLKQFDVKELLSLGLVSSRWHTLVQRSELWKFHALEISTGDPVPPREPDAEHGWLPLFKGLYFREQNWSRGIAQDVKVLKGHSNFVTSLDVHGDVLITGSYDETIRVWDLPTATCKLVLQAKAVSCLAFCAAANVFAAGFHDVGRTQVWSSVSWQPLQTLGGHLHGIRAIDINERYLVSAGADKAIVVTDWRTGAKVTRFGQQTNVNIGVQLIGDGDRIVSVTLDGIIRCFSISRREMIAQWKLSDMGGSDFDHSLRLSDVGGGHLGSGQLCWMAAKGLHLTCATKNLIIHLQWTEGDELVLDDPNPPPTPTSPSVSLHSRQRTLSNRSTLTPTRRTSSSGSSLLSLQTNSPSPQRTRTFSSVSTASGANPFRLGGPQTPTTPTFGGRTTGSQSQQQQQQQAPSTPRSPAFSQAVKKGVPAARLKRVANLGKKPMLVSLVDSPEVSIGFVDPGRRRVITSTRFSTRPGADKNLYLSTYSPNTTTSSTPPSSDEDAPPSPLGSLVPTTLRGAWLEHADSLGLRTAAMGPMSLGLDHEKIVVGTAGGDVYVVGMTGWGYRGQEHDE